MEQPPTQTRDLALPAVALRALKTALLGEVDEPTVTRAMHEAGLTAGLEFFRAFEASLGGPDARDLPQAEFWASLTRYFRRSGWGGIEHLRRHDGLGSLRSGDWAEADDSSQAADGGCWFSSGLLAGFLSGLAGGEVSVLEVHCRSRGDESCEFVFGSAPAIDALYRLLTADRDLDAALAEI
jgi:hypothetical protein